MADAREALRILKNDISDATNPMDVFALRGLLYDVSIFAFEDREHAFALSELRDVFDDGSANTSWADDAKRTLEGLTQIYGDDLDVPDRAGVAAVFFKQYLEHRGSGLALLDRSAELGAISEQTEPVYKALNEARSFQRLEDIIETLDDPAVLNYQGYSYDAFKKELRGLKQFVSDAKASQAGQDYSFLISDDTRKEVHRRMHRVLFLMGKDRNVPEGFGKDFDQQLIRHRANRGENMDEVRQLHSVEMMQLNIKDILTTYETMEDEGRRLFGDSREYKDMMAAAKKVCDLEKKMDYTKRDKIREMAAAMKDLHEAAEKYANKEAYKEKKTSRGISRKNKALALLELSDINTYKVVNMRTERNAVADMRLNDKESKDKTRKARTYGQLLDEELASNRKHVEQKRKKHEEKKQRERDKQISREIRKAK